MRSSCTVSRDVDIYYRKFEIKPPAEEVGAIVISNGRTESMAGYPELIWDLHQQGYSVYILDHRGQGFSTRLLPDPQKSYVEKFEDYVDDLRHCRALHRKVTV